MTTIIVSLESFLASVIATENAWLGSNDGLKFSYFETTLKARKASSSLAAVYLARLESFRKHEAVKLLDNLNQQKLTPFPQFDHQNFD